jgi:hypothetical protein
MFRVENLSDPDSPRAKRAKDAKFGYLFLFPLRSLRALRETIRIFGCGFAALRLCGEQ